MALAGALASLVLLASASAQVLGNVPFSRYESILERAPFGAPPPPPPPEPDPADVADAADEDEAYVIPPGLEHVKVTLLSRFRGIPAAGFVDGESNTPYYLLEGQSNDFELVSVDFPAQMIRLRRGGVEADLPLWINPATTNQADLSTFGMPAGSAPSATAGARVSATPVRTSPGRTSPRQLTPEEQKRREEFRIRREEARKQREAERERQREELAKLTPEQRERRLRDLNVEMIINDSGPPLPITLDDKDIKKLVDAGFDVPGHTPPTEKAPGRQ
jgi:hypothetical protein